MYITARMVTIQWEDEDSYTDTVFATRLNASSISIVCLVSLTVIVRIVKHIVEYPVAWWQLEFLHLLPFHFIRYGCSFYSSCQRDTNPTLTPLSCI